MKTFDWICLIACGLLLMPARSDEASPGAHVLSECHAADTASKAKILRQMARITFDSEEAAGDFWNEKSTEKRIGDFTPFTDAVAVAIFDEDRKAALNALADELEGK